MPSTGTGDPGSDFAEAPKRQQCLARHCCLPALSAMALLPSRAQRHALAARLDGADAQCRIQFLWELSCRCLFSTSELAVKHDWLCPCKKPVPVPLSCLPRAQPAVVPLPALVLPMDLGSRLHNTPLDSGSSDLFPSDSIGLSQRRETVRNEFSPEAGAELL